MLKVCYMEKTIYIMYTYVTYDFKYIFTYIYIYIHNTYRERSSLTYDGVHLIIKISL